MKRVRPNQSTAALPPPHYPDTIFGLHERGGESADAQGRAARLGLGVGRHRSGWDQRCSRFCRPGRTPAWALWSASTTAMAARARSRRRTTTRNSPRPAPAMSARSRGCHIWIIGNEPNHELERPEGRLILPHEYAQAYRLCRDAIKAVPGHADDQVLVAGPGPWNATTTYPGNEKGDWVRYFVHTMTMLGDDGCDGFALHTYTHRLDPQPDHRRLLPHDHGLSASAQRVPHLSRLHERDPGPLPPSAGLYHRNRPHHARPRLESGPQRGLGAHGLSRDRRLERRPARISRSCR